MIKGITLGYAILNNNVVLFTHAGEGDDYIYKIIIGDDDLFEYEIILQGNLGFKLDSYFETLPVYENENIQKIYWVDGVNQPRVINIANKYYGSDGINKINFIPSMNLNENVEILCEQSSGGLFPPGTVQYIMTYYNLNGSQSSSFYMSDLFYTSLPDRGGGADEKTNCVFNISISNTDNSFDFIRVYSVFRSSINDTPIVKRVRDIKLSEGNGFNMTDNNIGGVIEDASILLYLSTQNIVPNTIEQKDNTLFLGNYKLQQKTITEELKNKIKNAHTVLDGVDKVILTKDKNGRYPYNNLLKYSQEQISYLKYLEWYRFGVQFQDSFGNWSEAIWLGDYRQEDKPEMQNPISSDSLDITVKDFSIDLSQEMRNVMRNEGWVKMRPLIVYPKPEEREVVAQGIVCPTVYNVEDRDSNSPFAQSSWFARPNIPFDISHTRPRDIASNIMTEAKNIISNERDLRAFNYGAFIRNPQEEPNFVEGYQYSEITRDGLQYNGSKWIEFRHDLPIPSARLENGEIQNIDETGLYSGIKPIVNNSIYVSNDEDKNNLLNRTELFFVDQNIFTFHSPEISFNQSVNKSSFSNLKFRIVGSAALTGTSSNVSIETKSISQAETYNASGASPQFKRFGNIGFDINNDNVSLSGFKGLVSMPFWLDRWSNTGEYRPLSSFVVYPWHRESSLNNQTEIGSDQYPVRTAELDSKQMINLRFSGYSQYFDIKDIWAENQATHHGVSDIVLFDSTENTGVKVRAQENSGLNDFVYYGNIDKITRSSSNYPFVAGSFINTSDALNNTSDRDLFYQDYKYFGDLSPQPEISGFELSLNDPVRLRYKSGPHLVVALNYAPDRKQVVLPTHYHLNSAISERDSYSCFTSLPNFKNRAVNPVCFQPPGTKRFWESDESIYKPGLTGDTRTVMYWGEEDPYTVREVDISIYRWINQPPLTLSDIRFWYNPSFGILQETTGRNQWVNVIDRPNEENNNISCHTDEYGVRRFFNETKNGTLNPDVSVIQDVLPVNHDFGYFWIGEIYNDNIINRFGGTSQDALYQNEWIIAGKDTPIESGSLIYSIGDTYIQRYDDLKTYTSDPTNPNSITEIVSFFCETHENIDGRYDKNRGNIENLLLTPSTFNLFNPVYSQQNNLLTYHVVDNLRFSSNSFNNAITWTNTKVFGEDIDSWTKLNLVNNIDLDGEKGQLKTLTRLNNELYSFQEKGVSNILYNTRTQIPSSEYSNITIGNSGKVDGKVYLSQFGTNNRASVKTTPDGIYFMDSLTNGIYLFNGQNMRCLSDEFGFRDWVGSEVTNEDWGVNNPGGFITHYDETSDNAYFVNNKYCLNYSSYLNNFVSFFSYEDTPHMFNVNGMFLSVLHTYDNNSELYQNNAGERNMFYKNKTNTSTPAFEPYYVTVVANENPVMDKLFTNVDFKGDMFDAAGNYLPRITYDTLDLKTEYQTGTLNLIDTANQSSVLKKKFNRWRALTPRDNKNNRDRIRNNWTFVKLAKNDIGSERSELHDLLVYYYL
jgi:hypothetical protein